MTRKSCFVIAPIGEPDSETRKRSDQVLKHVIRPAVDVCGYAAVRADEIAEPGLITSQVIQRVVSEALVVADLTERNPNVFYELALRHASRKPLVQIIRKGDGLPFDIAGMRTIPVDHHDLDSVEEARVEMVKQIRSLERTDAVVDTPVNVALDLQQLRQSDNPEQRTLAEVLSTLADVRAALVGRDDARAELSKSSLPDFGRAILEMLERAISDVVAPYRQEIDVMRSARLAGVAGVYASRPDAIQALAPYIEQEPHEIVLVGSSLRGLLADVERDYEQARRLLRRKIRQGVKLRVLMTHPAVADLRARQEDRKYRDIGAEIIGSLEILIHGWNVDPADIRLYLGAPTLFGIRTSDAMLLNPYPYMKEAFASPCFIAAKPGYLFDHFTASHFRAWSSAIALPAPADPQVLVASLDTYASETARLLEKLVHVTGEAP